MCKVKIATGGKRVRRVRKGFPKLRKEFSRVGAFGHDLALARGPNWHP